MKPLERITFDDQICHGKACIRGMRWPVETILDMMAGGMKNEQILEDHPELEADDIKAALVYAKLSVEGFSIQDIV